MPREQFGGARVPFAIAQGVVLVAFVYVGVRAAMRYRPDTMVAN